MLRYAIVLQVALVATAASSAPDTQPTTIDKMSTVDAIKACRAELGRHGRYSQVRKCVSQKRMSTVEAIDACRAELGKNGKYLQVRIMCDAKNEKPLERREAQLQVTEPYAKSPMARCRSLTAGTLVSPSATLLSTFRADDDASLKHLFSCSAGFARKGFAEGDNCEGGRVALLHLYFARVPHENADVIDQSCFWWSANSK